MLVDRTDLLEQGIGASWKALHLVISFIAPAGNLAV
jgi:hypothetical protein